MKTSQSLPKATGSQNAETIAKCTGSVSATYREEQRMPDGSLKVISESSSLPLAPQPAHLGSSRCAPSCAPQHATERSPAASETIGRQFEQTRFELNYRLVGKDSWLRSGSFKTIREAQNAIEQSGSPILGGMVSFETRDRFEYRIVRQEMKCTVENVVERLL